MSPARSAASPSHPTFVGYWSSSRSTRLRCCSGFLSRRPSRIALSTSSSRGRPVERRTHCARAKSSGWSWHDRARSCQLHPEDLALAQCVRLSTGRPLEELVDKAILEGLLLRKPEQQRSLVDRELDQ